MSNMLDDGLLASSDIARRMKFSPASARNYAKVMKNLGYPIQVSGVNEYSWPLPVFEVFEVAYKISHSEHISLATAVKRLEYFGKISLQAHRGFVRVEVDQRGIEAISSLNKLESINEKIAKLSMDLNSTQTLTTKILNNSAMIDQNNSNRLIELGHIVKSLEKQKQSFLYLWPIALAIGCFIGFFGARFIS